MTGLDSKRLIVIAGPTAVGKTRMAIEIAKQLSTVIISADSRQIYKEMSIGTAKPSREELEEVKHYFVDEKSIEEEYDAGQYGRDALATIHQLFENYDSLVMTGGSGMYIRAVCEGFDEMPEIPLGTRELVIKEYEEYGLRWLQKQVEESDPDYFEEVDQKNPQRLMRALELIRATGLPASTFRKKKQLDHPFAIQKIGLEMDRDQLYARINARVDEMISKGLVDEARALYPQKHLNALQTVGYQEWFAHFDGEYDHEEAVRLLKRNTRRYAKRQLTWFKKDEQIKWFYADKLKEVVAYIDGK